MEERQPEKTCLPFRPAPNQFPHEPRMLVYDDETQVPDPCSAGGYGVKVVKQKSLLIRPEMVVKRIIELMEMYWQLEGTVLPLRKERDDLAAENVELKAKLLSETGRANEFERLHNQNAPAMKRLQEQKQKR